MAVSGTQSLERALSILELVGRSNGMHVMEICAQLDLNKSTVSRLLSTLTEYGFVEKNNGVYRVGLKVIELSSNRLNAVQLRTEALPYMEELQKKTGLIVHLGTLADDYIVYLEKLSSYTNIRMYSQIGKRAYVHSTGLGKAICAYKDRDIVKEIIDRVGMPARTEKTNTDPDRFFRVLDETRKRGYVVDIEENEDGVICIAAPVFDYRCQPIAAVSATGFLETFPMDSLDSNVEKVLACTRAISRRMGYFGEFNP